VGVASFFCGAGYAISHHAPVRYGFAEYITGPMMLLSFCAFLGIKLRDKPDDAPLFSAGEVDITDKLNLARLVWIGIFCLGGALLGAQCSLLQLA
jgi:hypothetical protein